MLRPLRHYFKVIRKFPELSLSNRLLYLHSPLHDFTRVSPLRFCRTTCLILSLIRKSTVIELFNLFDYHHEKPVTKSAFSQRRKLIKPAFFKDLFLLSAKQFYRSFKNHHTWRGLRLFAVDGKRLGEETIPQN